MGKWLLLVLLLGGAWTPVSDGGKAGDERPLNEVIWPVGG